MMKARTRKTKTRAALLAVLWKIIDYVIDNPIKVASATVLSFWRTAFVDVFYSDRFYAGYNESSVSLLYAVALLGIFFAGYVMLTMVAPGLALHSAKGITKNITSKHLFCITAAASICWAIEIAFQFD